MPDQVEISPTLADMAHRFNIDLASIADEALLEHVLREPMKLATARMQSAMLASQGVSHQFGHSYIGCEHVFLAILLDPESIPSQILRRLRSADEVLEQLTAVLSSEEYNAPVAGDSSDVR